MWPFPYQHPTSEANFDWQNSRDANDHFKQSTSLNQIQEICEQNIDIVLKEYESLFQKVNIQPDNEKSLVEIKTVINNHQTMIENQLASI